MKIARTYTMDYDLAQKLKRKPNQSKIVNKAVRRYLSHEENITIDIYPTKQLLAAARERDDCPKHLKLLIMDFLTSS